MIELLRAVQILGLRKLLSLRRGARLAWNDAIGGYYATRTIQALLNVGFLEELQEKTTVDLKDFATRANLDLRILQSLCDVLYALGILGKTDTMYSLEPKGQLLMEVCRGWFEGVYGYEGIVHELEALLRREKVYGRDLSRRYECIASGSAQMEEMVYFPLALDMLQKSGARRVLDLGCGEGSFLRYLCRNDQQATAYGVDISSEGVELAQEKARTAGLQDRIHVRAVDLTELRAAPASWEKLDAAVTFFVLHEILFSGEDAVIDCLRSFRNLFPAIPLIVIEAIRPTTEEMRQKPGMAIQYYLQHDLSNQKPVGRQAWRSIFKKAGFADIQERYFGFARTSFFTLR